MPGGLVTWTRELGIVVVDFEGAIRRADEPSGEWREIDRLDGSPAALEAVGEELLAATHDARVLSSRDGGKNWQVILGQ